MPLETSITVSPNLAAALNGLKPGALRESIGRGMLRATELITGQIRKTRLSGKGPYPVAQQKLGIRSGLLKRALDYSKNFTISGNTVQTSIGTPVKYARAHEFGFSGSVNVKAGRMKITQVFGRKLSAPLTVQRKAFARKVDIPERRPIRAGITENLPLIEKEIIREIKRGALQS